MLSVKQGSIKYHFLNLWYDSTWDWIQVSRAIGEHSNHYAMGNRKKEIESLLVAIQNNHYAMGNRKKEIESLLVATQNNAIRTMLKRKHIRHNKLSSVRYVVIETKLLIS